MKAVIQAGGKGTRLLPYTMVLPKPLMPVGRVPVIEVLLRWLRRHGVEEAYITIGHLGGLLRAFCGDGSSWDMRITYVEEKEPLGTVGGLALLSEELDETFLLLNGDLITDLDLRALWSHHRSHGGSVTVGVTQKCVTVDLGVLDVAEGRMTGFREKPTIGFLASMGIYCMEPDILDLIPRGVPFGFDDLMLTMLDRDRLVHVYEHSGLWMDIGREEDFREAQESYDEGLARHADR